MTLDLRQSTTSASGSGNLRILVLGLGNDLLADDGIGIAAARRLETLLGKQATVTASAMHGMALLDLFIGFDRVLLIDAIQTKRHPPGTILELDPASLRAIPAPSPHYSGIPELLAVARELQLDFPARFEIFGVEVADSVTIGGAMTPAVAEAVPRLCELIQQRLAQH